MARFHLRLSDEEFFDLTPRQFHLLLDRHREQTKHEELLTGILAAVVANHSFAPPKKPVGPGEYMPSEWQKRTLDKPERINRARIADQARSFLMARVGIEH